MYLALGGASCGGCQPAHWEELEVLLTLSFVAPLTDFSTDDDITAGINNSAERALRLFRTSALLKYALG